MGFTLSLERYLDYLNTRSAECIVGAFLVPAQGIHKGCPYRVSLGAMHHFIPLKRIQK